MHGLEAEFWGQIDFIYLDQYDRANREFFDEYGLRGRPIFVLMEPDGTEVTRWFGARPGSEIRDLLNAYLQDYEVETSS